MNKRGLILKRLRFGKLFKTDLRNSNFVRNTFIRVYLRYLIIFVYEEMYMGRYISLFEITYSLNINGQSNIQILSFIIRIVRYLDL